MNAVIRLYQWLISPLLGKSCRFTPTCSCYAREALARHGLLKGGALALRRVLRCQPWIWVDPVDPVPDEPIAWRDILSYNSPNTESGTRNSSRKRDPGAS